MKDTHLQIRLTTEEKERVKVLASEEGVSQGRFIRDYINAEWEKYCHLQDVMGADKVGNAGVIEDHQ